MMGTEIEIEDLGTYRLPNIWQLERIKRIPRRHPARRLEAALAYGMGMEVTQFRKLSREDRERVRSAYLKLSSPANV